MANVEAVLAQLGEEFAQSESGAIPESLETLDERLAEALHTDGRQVLSGVLYALGREAPYGVFDGCREVTIGSLLGYVTYSRLYYAPVASLPTRQSRRKAAREKVARRKRKGCFPRTGDAPCACPLDAALGLKDGMTPALRDRAQHAAALSGSFAEGAATLKRFAGINMSESTFRRKALAAGERAVAAQEYPALRFLAPRFKQGLYIGSGLVEAACRTDVARRCNVCARRTFPLQSFCRLTVDN